MIIAKEYIKSGFSAEDAEILDKVIKPLFEKNEKIIVDFSDVRNFTTLFFNQIFAQYLVEVGPDKYEKLFDVQNLSNVGKMTYGHSIENAKDYYKKNPQERQIHDSVVSEDIDS